MSQTPLYTDGEKVLCYHGPLLYEAKCLKSDVKDNTLKYFIHYNGWNKNWDEWVPECRVLAYNDLNLEKQKELASNIVKKPKKSRSSKSSSKKNSAKEVIAPVIIKQIKTEKKEVELIASAECAFKPPESKKPKVVGKKVEPKKVKLLTPKVENLLTPKLEKPPEPKIAIPPAERELEDDPKPAVEIKLHFPEILRNWLVDDSDLITHKRKLLRLPARITVDHIIANYVKYKVSVKGFPQKMEVTIISVANRIRDCFNVLLGKRLLYKFERPQYAEILKENANLRMCEIYGAAHMLRMFTTLGSMLSPIAEMGHELSSVVGHLDDFIWFIGSNPNFFSLDDYVIATPEYYRRALM